ncbi:MAG: hypothetical protein WCA15_12080 [Candidatus Acidiferrales bacterium]
MNLARINKNSSKNLALSAVLFSCFGGIDIGFGLHQLMTARVRFDWIVSLLFGSAFVLYGIFWAVMLARRADSGKMQAPMQ